MTALPHGSPVQFRAPPPPRCDYCRRWLDPKASCQGCGAPTGYREPPPMQVVYPAHTDMMPSAVQRYQASLDALDGTPRRRRLFLMPVPG